MNFKHINRVNECANLIQTLVSGFSFMRRRWKEAQNPQHQEDDVQQLRNEPQGVLQLQSEQHQEDSALPFQSKPNEDDVLQLQSDLNCLRDTVRATYKLIDRAEWKIHEHCVADLLSELKHAVYDSEDLLDEFRWYEQKVTIEGEETQLRSLVDFFNSVTNGSFNKVTDIQKRICNLSSLLDNMSLHQATPRFDKSVRPETSSLPTETKIFGREKELKEVIELLGVSTANRSAHSKRKRTNISQATIQNVPVLPIVGIGGIGKTTLAQNICNHSQVKSHFSNIIWICVSDDFDVKRLTKEAIQSSSGEATTDNLDSLQHALAKYVKQNVFLIVLDDMWDDALKEDGQCWNRFYAPFTNACEGSRMLITTRSQKVADLVRTSTTMPFQLEGLKKEVFWDFFKQCAFGFRGSYMNCELERIGKEILPKLRGSPLAAKTLGRLLGMSRDTTHWNTILTSELWELGQNETDILPALRLSYIYLPYRLKRCFSFCAVYPKDHRFEKASLTEMWVAQGFVEPRGNIPLQVISHQYFDDLVNRSFFQIVRSKYLIHDLMHDMAQLVSKDECFIIKNTSDIQKVHQNVRHLSIMPNSDLQCSNLSTLKKHKKLRTLLCNKSLRIETGPSVLEHWCTELRFIRVFTFKSIKELPNSVVNMKHLRYLQISHTCPLVNLPSGIFSLYNLQRFESSLCKFLQEHDVADHATANKGQRKKLKVHGFPGEYLPAWCNPQNLTSLSIHGCDGLKVASVCGNSEHTNPNEVPVAPRSNMVLVDRSGSIFSSLIDVAIEKCESLSSLEELQPAYMPVIKKIVIKDCTNLESVATDRFGEFPFLEDLKVCNCPNINSRHLLSPSLKKLELENSGNLGENIECSSLIILNLSHHRLPSVQLQKWSLPVLENLTISRCESLIFIGQSEPISIDVSIGGARSSTGKFPLLTHLKIEFCKKLETLDEQLLNLRTILIDLTACKSLSLPTERLGNFRSLKKLNLSSCNGLQWERGMVLPSSLQKLSLWSCGDFSASFPKCLENLTSLVYLEIGICGRIVSIPANLWNSNLSSLQELRIESCPDLESIGGQRALANIQVVLIQDCKNLKGLKQPMRRGIWRGWRS